jgi:hypothetical protein
MLTWMPNRQPQPMPSIPDSVVKVGGVAPTRDLQVLQGRFWAKCTNTCRGSAEMDAGTRSGQRV